MNSSSDGVIIHENWSRWLIIILWACCGASLILCICKSIKERCMNLVEDPLQIFRTRPRRRHPSDPVAHGPSIHSESRGLPTPVIHSLPSIQFTGEIKGSSTECAVCLSEFLEGEWLRLLPNCGHVFHSSCVDTWFCSHSNCPLCRTSVLHGFSICNSENRTEATRMNSSRSHSVINLQ